PRRRWMSRARIQNLVSALHADLRTQLRQGARFALRLAGVADLTAVEDHAVAEHRPLFRRDQFHQVALDFFGVRMFGEAHAAAEAENVRVHGDAGDAEGVAEDDVGGLAADSGQRDKLVHGAWDFTGVLVDDGFAAGGDVASFVPEETGGLNRRLQFPRIGVRE